MGELVKNAELGHKVAAEGFDGPALDPFPKGRMPSNRVSLYLLRVVWGEWGTVIKCGREVLAS
jgi:hypothetical protein